MKKRCLCKKNFYDNIENKFQILFEKGKYYKYEIEYMASVWSSAPDELINPDDKCAWIIFNKDGFGTGVGRRFFYKKGHSNFRLCFGEYFENERLTKLKKINENT